MQRIHDSEQIHVKWKGEAAGKLLLIAVLHFFYVAFGPKKRVFSMFKGGLGSEAEEKKKD